MDPDINRLAYMEISQAEKIKTLLQWRGDRGAFVYELNSARPNGLGIAQYNARVFELRQQGFDIVDNSGHFVLKNKGQISMF